MDWSLSLDLLTPAFIGGTSTPMGDRRLDPAMPFRPSSIRGLLRYWFRAAAAAVLVPARDQEDTVVEALRAVEAGIFGDTSRASPVIVDPPSGGATRPYRRDEPARTQWRGLRYLGYGLFEGKRGSEALVTPPALQVRLRLRRVRGAEAEAVASMVSAALWLWLHLGGLGARSRRGFGAVHVPEPPAALGWPPEIHGAPADREQLIDQLTAGLDWVAETMTSALAALRNATPELQRVAIGGEGRRHQSIRTIDGIETVAALALSEPSGEAALERAGCLFQDFRSTLRRRDLGLPPLPDYHTVKHSLQSDSPARDVDRAAFGLPLSFYFRSLGGAKTRFSPDTSPGKSQYDRVASPLIFRVHRLYPDGPASSPRHTVVLVNLAERDGLPLLGRRLRQHRTRGTIGAPDAKIIDQFIDWALARSERQAAPRRGGTR